MRPRGLTCLAGLLLAACQAAAASVPFFEKGRTDWTVAISAGADPTERYAAVELTNALARIGGAVFPVVSNAPAGGRVIVIGDLRNPEVRARAEALQLHPGEVEESAVRTLDGRLYLVGNNPRGALYAVYSFLQNELGVRWLWPGPDGAFMPRRDSWGLPELAYGRLPVIPYRGFHLCGDYYREPDAERFREWMARNFINVYRHAAPPREKRRGFYSMWSSHNVRLPPALFAAHPGYFAEIGGRRYDSNICFSHPEVDRLVAAETAAYVRKHPALDLLSVFPSDNMNYCRCAACSKMDVSTAWFEFYNRLTDTLKAEFPDLKFATLAYQGFRDVPACKIRNTAFVEYATYDRCNMHPYGQPDCPKNATTVSNLVAWKATGIPIGNYGYEYDIFSRNGRFLPFLSMIDNGIKTARDMGLATVIPEVLLMSTNYAPDIRISSVQNRLSLYVYARLLWEPDRTLAEVLADWSRTVYANAAPPMAAYYTRMDRAWSALPLHAGILGDALGVAPVFLAGSLQEEVAADFAAAGKAIDRLADPAVRERAAAALLRERILFDQWRQLARLHADVLRINLPLLEKAEDLAHVSSRPQVVGSNTAVRLAWTRDALHVNWRNRCPDPAALDKEDAVELELGSGVTGERWLLAVDRRGTRTSARVADVGTRDANWNPAWQAEVRAVTGGWEAEMTVPFASLGQPARSNESWQARFHRRQTGSVPAVFPERDPAMVYFCAAGRTDRTVLWWAGCPERENREQNGVKPETGLIEEFARIGWDCQVVTNRERLAAWHGRSDAFWFRHPAGPNKLPLDYALTQLAPAVSNGAVAFFVSYWDIPLDRYFNDLSLKVKVISSALPLAARKSATLAPGEWSRQPHDLLRRLETRITPAYGFVPAVPEAWTVLASAPSQTGEPFPYLLAARYGKGLIVVGGDSIPVSPAALMDNLLRYHQDANSASP